MADTTLKTGESTYSSAIEDAVNYTGWVLSVFHRYIGSSIMEVGLGHGSYRKYLPADTRYVGVDIDAECVARAEFRYPRDRFITADITDTRLVEKLDSAKLDTVLCVNVLEHVEDDRQAASNLLATLRPGGHLLIFVPAFSFLYSDLDRLAGHVRRYAKRDLQRLTGKSGRVVLARYFNSLGGLGWLANKAFRHNSLNSQAVNSQIKLFDTYAVPVARVLDCVTSRFFGQSLVCVIRKT